MNIWKIISENDDFLTHEQTLNMFVTGDTFEEAVTSVYANRGLIAGFDTLWKYIEVYKGCSPLETVSYGEFRTHIGYAGFKKLICLERINIHQL